MVDTVFFLSELLNKNTDDNNTAAEHSIKRRYVLKALLLFKSTTSVIYVFRQKASKNDTFCLLKRLASIAVSAFWLI